MKMTVATKDDSQFHLLFTSLPLDEKLIEEYTCSYNEGAAVSIGKLYISQHHVSYASKIGSTHIILPIKDITYISKKNSVYLFPNAIEIHKQDHKYFFSAFLSRDLAFATLTTIISQGAGTRTKIFEDALSDNVTDAKDVKPERSFIKFSNEEIELPLPPSAYDDSPFVENPTFSAFKPSNQSTFKSNTNNNSSNNNNNNSSNNEKDNDKELSEQQQSIDDTNSNSSDSSRFNSNKTATPSPSPSPSNKMLASKIERKDSIESNSSEPVLNTSGGFSTANLDTSKRIGSQIDILSNHRNSMVIQSQNTTIVDDHPLSDSSQNGDDEQSSFEPIITRQDSSQNLSTPLKDSSNNNNNNNVQSPLKSSQTINNQTPSSPSINRKHNNNSNSNNNQKLDQSPPNVSPTNSSRDLKERPQLQKSNQSTTSLNSSTQSTTVTTQSPTGTTAASAASAVTISNTSPTATTTTSPTATNTSDVTQTTTSQQSADSPKVSSLSSFERLPTADKCDHITVSEFDEAPWSTEKYQISLQEFYELIIRGDFWGSVNTTHSYTEQTVSEWKQNTNCCIHRNMDFRTAISFKIGPKSTRVAQTQRCKLKNKSELILQSTSISKDVPYGDSFSVENLLVVQSIDSTSCLTKLSSKIKFTKSVWGLSSMIQKSALQGNKEFFILWNTMVRNQIETYVYNKMKEAKKQTTIAAQPAATIQRQPSIVSQQVQQPAQQQQQPIQQQQIQQQEVKTTTSSSTIVSTAIPEAPVSSTTQQATVRESSITTSSTTGTVTGFTLEEGETLSTAIWKKMSTIEKGALTGIFFIILILLFGLMYGIMSNYNTSNSLNNQLYRFSDSLILLDSRINALATNTPIDDGKVTYTTNIQKDKMQSIRDRLEMANSLLLRAQSMVSTLQAELSLEDLKSQKVDNYYSNSNNFDSSNRSGFFGLGSFIITSLAILVTIFIFKFKNK